MIHNGVKFGAVLERNAKNEYELIYKPIVKNDNNKTGEQSESRQDCN
jgi:hypothetical protein